MLGDPGSFISARILLMQAGIGFGADACKTRPSNKTDSSIYSFAILCVVPIHPSLNRMRAFLLVKFSNLTVICLCFPGCFPLTNAYLGRLSSLLSLHRGERIIGGDSTMDEEDRRWALVNKLDRVLAGLHT